VVDEDHARLDLAGDSLAAGLAFMETVVQPLAWDDWPEWARGMFQALRRPGEGEELILDRSFFVEFVIPHSVQRTLSDEELGAYRAPVHRAGLPAADPRLAPRDPHRRRARRRRETGRGV
jgi:hypothetical protein